MIVSVIIPFLVDDEKLNRAVNSVLGDQRNVLEILLVCDNPLINKQRVLKKFGEQKIKCMFNDANHGAGYSRRLGIEKAEGEVIAFLDSDDEWIDGKLDEQLAILKNPNVVACCTSIDKFESGLKKQTVSVPKLINYDMLLKKNYVPMSSAVVKSDLIRSEWMTDLRRRQDYVFWLLILNNNPNHIIRGVEKSYVRYNVTPGSLSDGNLQNVRYNYLAFRRGLGFSILRSVKQVCINVFMKVFQ